jgi:thiol-disulfide isomerase/thioredoxin
MRQQDFVFSLPPTHLAGLLAGLLLSVASVVMATRPEFSFPDLDGEFHTLSEYVGQGKWTIVNILAAGCAPCQTELPVLVRFHEEHRRSDATVLGIALDYPGFRDADHLCLSPGGGIGWY